MLIWPMGKMGNCWCHGISSWFWTMFSTPRKFLHRRCWKCWAIHRDEPSMGFSPVTWFGSEGSTSIPPLIIQHGWLENPRTEWKFLERKITDFYGPFSSTPWLIWLMTPESKTPDGIEKTVTPHILWLLPSIFARKGDLLPLLNTAKWWITCVDDESLW